MLAKLVKIVRPIIFIEYENRKRMISFNPVLRKYLLSKSDKNKYLWRNTVDVKFIFRLIENQIFEDYILVNETACSQ